MHLFYIDESGSADFADPDRRYFVLAAVGIREDFWTHANAEFSRLKQAIFGTPDVELKSAWLRNPTKCRVNYLERYDISERDLSQGMDGIYGLMVAPELTYCAVVVDKSKVIPPSAPQPLRHRFSVRETHAVAYIHLHETLVEFLARLGGNARGLLIHDMVQDHQKTGSGYQPFLQQYHERTNSVSEEAFLMMINRRPSHERRSSHIIGDMHFEDSERSHFLQVADLAAYNILRQFQMVGDLWDEAEDWARIEGYPYFQSLVPRLMKGDDGTIKGLGLRQITDDDAEIFDAERDEEDDDDNIPSYLREAFPSDVYYPDSFT